MHPRKVKLFSFLLVYAVVCALMVVFLLLTGCTAPQRATFKAHALETGIAAGGGALAVATGGAAAIPIFIGAMGTAALVGEVEKPPPQTEHTTTVLSQDGKVLSQKTTTGATPKATVSAMQTILDWLTFKVLAVIGLVIIALLFPGARAMAVSTLGTVSSLVKKGGAWALEHMKSVKTQVRPAVRSSRSTTPKDPINPQ
jgi:amino acid transporter